jgi:hypothetical protein
VEQRWEPALNVTSGALDFRGGLGVCGVGLRCDKWREEKAR